MGMVAEGDAGTGSRAAAVPPPVGAVPRAATACAGGRQAGRPRALSAESPAWSFGATAPGAEGRGSPPWRFPPTRGKGECAPGKTSRTARPPEDLCSGGPPTLAAGLRRLRPGGPSARSGPSGLRLLRMTVMVGTLSSVAADDGTGWVGHGVVKGSGGRTCRERRIAGRSRSRRSHSPGRGEAAAQPPKARLVHYRESGFSLPSLSMFSGVPGRRAPGGMIDTLRRHAGVLASSCRIMVSR